MKIISKTVFSLLILTIVCITSITYFSIPKKDYQYFVNHPDKAHAFYQKCHSILLENLKDGDHDAADDVRNDTECLSAKSFVLDQEKKHDRNFIAKKRNLIQEQKLKEGTEWEDRYQRNLATLESVTWDEFLVVKNECLSKPMDRRDFAVCSAIDHLYGKKMQIQTDYISGMNAKDILKYYHDSCESEAVKSRDSCHLIANVFSRLKQDALSSYPRNSTLLKEDYAICKSSSHKKNVFNEKVVVTKEDKILFCELIKQSSSVAFATIVD